MRKNVASQTIGAQMVSATDGSAFTGAVTVFVTGDGGTQAQGTVGSGACAHEGNGYHSYGPAQAETNFDHIAFTFTGTGAVPVTVQVYPNFPQTGDNFARLGAPAGASVSADIAAVNAKTTNLPTDPADQSLVIAATDAIMTRLGTPAGASVSADIAVIEAQTDDIGAAGAGLTAVPWNPAWDAEVQSEVNDGLIAYDAATGSDVPSAATVADAVWDEAIAGHLAAGSTGEALNGAGAAGDPWLTALPGAYGAGSAGKIVGDNLNATVGSRATQTSVDDLPTNAELATALAGADDAVLAAIAALNNLSQANVRSAIGLASANLDTQLDALPTNAELATALAAADDATLAAIASALATILAAIPSAVDNADTLLKRDWTAVSGEASRSALNALRFLRNRFSTTTTPGSVDVFKEDGTTVAFSKGLTTDPAAEPIVEG